MISNTAISSEDHFVKTLWVVLSQRKNPTHVLTMTDIISKIAAHPKSKPVNDSLFFITKWLMENSQSELAESAGIPPQYIGFVESKVSLESIPSHLLAEDCTLNDFSDEVRGAIRIIDKAGQISFLASDSKSLINKMVDYTANTLDVFIVGEIPEGSVDALRKNIEKKARG